MSRNSFCADCKDFLAWLIAGPDEYNFYHFPKDGVEIDASAIECGFCNLLKNAAWFDWNSIRNIEIAAGFDQAGRLSSMQVHGMMESHAAKVFSLNVWASSDSQREITENISAFKPIEELGDPDTFSLIDRWTQRCLSSHHDCQRSLTGELLNELSEKVPSKRILDIGTSVDCPVRLISTEGVFARYCVLSHCWGPPEKKPMCLTSANEMQLRGGIKYDLLPKTFRDAITVTRGIGVRYLWVDSLCISQEGKKEWSIESSRMGSIYENAFLRIAASSARDSTQGFLPDNISAPDDISTPNILTVDGKYSPKGTIFINKCESAGNTFSADQNPLDSRAWVFQEGRLSRRTIHFVRGSNGFSIDWQCRHKHYNIRDEICARGEAKADWSQWESNVHKYTSTKLTFESDRLIAISGLVDKISQVRPGEYVNGIWANDLPQQLLWVRSRLVMSSRYMEGLPDLPSWTWAKLPGRKIFPYHEGRKGASQDSHLCTSFICFQNFETITLNGNLTRCFVSSNHIHGNDGRRMPFCPEWRFFGHDTTNGRYVFADESKENVIGQVEFDEHVKDSKLHYSIISVGHRDKHDFLHPENKKNHQLQGAEKVFTLVITPPEEATPARQNEGGLTDWEYTYRYARYKTFYWVLFLEPVSDQQDTYRRVGMGILWPNSWVEAGGTKQIFNII